MRIAEVSRGSLKGILSLLLVAAFLYNIFGYFVIFQVNRAKVRSEMARQLAASGKKVLVLTIPDWEKAASFRKINEKEFVYKGQMFDVLREVKKGSATIYYCLRDSREELLMAGLRKASTSKEAQQLVHHLITLAMPASCGETVKEPFLEILYPSVKDTLADRPHAPSPPPPKVC